MTTDNTRATEQLSLIDNPSSRTRNHGNAGSPTKSTKSTGENGEAMDSLIIPPEDPKSQCKCACYWLIGIFLFCVLAAAVVILTFLILRVGGQPPVVMTTCGKVQGIFNFQNNHFSFMGVPYAMPPVESRRWQPPVPMSNSTGNCWPNHTEVWDASQPAAQCVQRDMHSGGATGSEDCLYLNIHTPRVGQQNNLPVVVWIHGGDFDTGNASIPGFTPDGDLAKAFGIVFVSIQYRLNAFGFLVLKEFNSTANLGLQDQIVAMNWIQENIANFGGNPEHVTVIGQGSGGSSVLALMVSPLATGLFHRAWAASPATVLNTSLVTAAEQNAFFVDSSGCGKKEDVKQCLLELSASDVLRFVFTKWNDPTSYALPMAHEKIYGRMVIDGNVIQSSLMDSFKSGAVTSDVPLLIGSTAQEVDVNPEPIDIADKDNSSYVRIVEEQLDTFVPMGLSAEALNYYPFTKTSAGSKDQGAEKALTSMVSDVRVNCPVDELANAATAALKSPVFRYVVTLAPSQPMHGTLSIYGAKYAFHELDLMAFFGTMDSFFTTSSSSAADTQFAATLRKNVIAFITSGKPSDPRWLNFNTTTALADESFSFVSRYHKEECSMWKSYDLLKFGWKL